MKNKIYYILFVITIANGGCKKNELTTPNHQADILSAKYYFEKKLF